MLINGNEKLELLSFITVFSLEQSVKRLYRKQEVMKPGSEENK